MRCVRYVTLAAVLLMIAVNPAAAQEAPPAGPFRAVHLVNLTPQQVAMLQAWMADINAAIDKTGHKDARYRLYKVTGKQAGPYEYMWESSWPSGAVYAEIHEDPAWRAVGAKHPGVNGLLKDEIYTGTSRSPRSDKETSPRSRTCEASAPRSRAAISRH